MILSIPLNLKSRQDFMAVGCRNKTPWIIEI